MLRLSPDTARVMPLVAPVVAGGATAVGVAAWRFAAEGPSARVLAGLLALLAAGILAEIFPVPIENVPVGGTSLATIFIVGAAVLYGWEAAVLLGFLTVVPAEIGRRRPPVRLAFNSALYALSAAAAGFAIHDIGRHGVTSLVLAALAASASFWLTNVGLLTAIVARHQGESFIRYVWRYVFWTALPFAFMASVTAILVVLWDLSPFVTLALVGPLAAIALYQRSVQGVLDRLREIDRIRDDFMATVSHELRTPLASVYGAALTLRKHDLSDDRREAMLGIIHRESTRLARVVDDVLLASQIGSSNMKMVIERFDAKELAGEAVEAVRTHLPPGLSVELDAPIGLPPVAADAERVSHVLANLLENAIKYSPEGGRITVALEPRDRSMRFAVRDEGIGIPPEQQERIFEKFHRLDPTLRRGIGGTGLGLYICRELLRAMGGRIWVTSHEGAGSTFTFELPLAGGDGARRG
jgi:signal transduction histidine kinase